MDKFTILELKNILHNYGIIDLSSYDKDEDKPELYSIVKAYKINTPVYYDTNMNNVSWVYITKPFHFNVRSLLSLKEGDTLEFIFLSHNDNDYFDEDNCAIYKPLDFFKEMKIISYNYIHKDNYSGYVKFGKEWKEFDWQIETYPHSFTFDYENVDIKYNMRVGFNGPCIDIRNIEFCPDIML